MSDATLRSNRGSESLVFQFLQRNDCGPDPGADASVRLALSSYSTGEPHPVLVDLGVLHLSLIEAGLLYAKLTSWLALPIASLAKQPLELSVPLAFKPADRLDLVFGDRRDSIASGKQTATVSFAAGQLTGEAHFVVDQSCIQQSATQLATAFAGLGYESSAA